MIRIVISRYIFIIAIVASIISLVSCEKVNDWHTDDSYKRLFTPVIFETANVDSSAVVLRFSQSANADSYVIQLSTDSLLFNTIAKEIPLSVTPDLLDQADVDGNLLYAVEKLNSTTLYSARIKARSSAGIPESRWAAITFTTP